MRNVVVVLRLSPAVRSILMNGRPHVQVCHSLGQGDWARNDDFLRAMMWRFTFQPTWAQNLSFTHVGDPVDFTQVEYGRRQITAGISNRNDAGLAQAWFALRGKVFVRPHEPVFASA